MIPHCHIIMKKWPFHLIPNFQKEALKDGDLRWFLSSQKQNYSQFIMAVTFSPSDGNGGTAGHLLSSSYGKDTSRLV